MKRTKIGKMLVARPLSPKEKKNVMAHLTHDMKPIREEEISQVEMNEEFGLAGKMMLTLLYQWLNADSRKEMERLVRFYHPLDKAGAYGIQEWIGHIGVTALNGSYFNVMGLPVQRIYMEMQDF